jgi:dUTP pyrophosphatase
MDKMINDYIQKLRELERQISNDEDVDFVNGLDDVLKNLTSDIQASSYPINTSLEIKVKKLSDNAVIPSYAKDGDAGMDLTITKEIENTSFSVSYGFGIAIEIPRGYVGLIFPRSSVRNQDLILSNGVGVVDCVPSGTKIKTINGDINVEDLFENISIPILSYNEELNSIETDMVTDMWIVENKDLLRITTEDGDIVELPHEKEVFTKSGWKKVFDLTENDEILRFM